MRTILSSGQVARRPGLNQNIPDWMPDIRECYIQEKSEKIA